jgi:hypothetical protein
MNPTPWRPETELEGALARGDLRYAMALAEELRRERGRPIGLDLAARFLPLVASESPREYDAWALRWLARWATESAGSTEQAAELAASLAELPAEPAAMASIRELL